MTDQERIIALENIIIEMLDELSPASNGDHRQLTLKALRALGLTDTDIRQYIRGEIILTPRDEASADTEDKE